MNKRTPFTKLLVANRGEIAVRVLRSARNLGYQTVAVYSEPDADAVHVAMADQSVCIGSAAPAESYLRIDRIIEAAKLTGADAIHPGYGFLAENQALPAACAAAGIVFVGPSAESIVKMGDKAGAKALMIAAGVPCVPGYQGDDQSLTTLQAEADRIGYPLMIKATAGGGGRGMRLVQGAAGFADHLKSAKSEAKSAFGNDIVLLERAIINPRHVEIQIMADRHGNAIHCGERDCSVQRRHQKVIEEAPSPAVSPALRARMGKASTDAVLAIGYEGAGTFEYLLDENGDFFFMEMNTRLQVEHPVTEAITGLDLVALQLRVASGELLGLTQEDVQFSGHAIEVRLCAEDPGNDFMPQSGRLNMWKPAAFLRVEHGLRDGSDIPPFYDSMIAKLIAFGDTREDARRKLISGVEATIALGVRTNQSFLASCLKHPVFGAGGATTGFIEQNRDALLPDTETAERQAAMLVAALLRASPSTSLAHGYSAPIRLSRGAAEHTVKVIARGLGECLVECDGETMALTVRSVTSGVYDYVLNGLATRAALSRDGNAVFAHIDGAQWDFIDNSLTAKSTGEVAGSDGKVRASMNGGVVSVDVVVGDTVTRGQKLLVVEAMKMEHTHASVVNGVVTAVHVVVGGQVTAHSLVVEVEPEAITGDAA
ncbi:acetyl-CoA carboxylase biotin carboxylase subunit [Thalassovita taeanensis]|uniref:Geranyl-CoA carboxylase alpha subunit n=1 Tax=Thalassovita taeanensis TaxID=657014 RepID=A0A1H9BA53_9RHOB|nr:acetyl-CoA carboxylase biotin carboxylase subunit [Thalassovita taeanensis]SEP85844.1 geranyl-CoA carboxylase alpha subunit [Thalassovita taeanensis]